MHCWSTTNTSSTLMRCSCRDRCSCSCSSFCINRSSGVKRSFGIRQKLLHLIRQELPIRQKRHIAASLDHWWWAGLIAYFLKSLTNSSFYFPLHSPKVLQSINIIRPLNCRFVTMGDEREEGHSLEDSFKLSRRKSALWLMRHADKCVPLRYHDVTAFYSFGFHRQLGATIKQCTR